MEISGHIDIDMRMKTENILPERKSKIMKNRKTAKEKLIILPETGLAMRTLPPIIAERDVILPSKTPTSPLVQV